MNKDIIEGEWNQVRGEVQRQWGKLTNDQLDVINGNRTKLMGALQETYGVVRDDAEKQLNDWETSRRRNSAA
jgi:uncharacterized protein YjbJ (UPF0337 family)